jgi:uncharacterized protein YjbI with pentapeptide repeats
LALLAGVLAAVGAIYTARTFALNRAGQITERFTRAIDQIGSEKPLEVRLGGIYALERIAHDSRNDHPQVMEVLTAYVRENAPGKQVAASAADGTDDGREGHDPLFGPPDPQPRTDVQAILTVLGRRDRSHEQPPLHLNLRHTDLRGAVLDGHLEGANLMFAHLERASLYSDSHLEEALLTGAHMDRVSAIGAHFERATLDEAELEEALLSEAHLQGARLNKAHLEGATLFRAHLEGAWLAAAHLKQTVLTEAVYGVDDHGVETHWPVGYDADAAGALRVDAPDAPDADAGGLDVGGVRLAVSRAWRAFFRAPSK